MSFFAALNGVPGDFISKVASENGSQIILARQWNPLIFPERVKRGHQLGYVDMGHIAASQNFFLADLPSLTVLVWGS